MRRAGSAVLAERWHFSLEIPSTRGCSPAPRVKDTSAPPPFLIMIVPHAGCERKPRIWESNGPRTLVPLDSSLPPASASSLQPFSVALPSEWSLTLTLAITSTLPQPKPLPWIFWTGRWPPDGLQTEPPTRTPHSAARGDHVIEGAGNRDTSLPRRLQTPFLSLRAKDKVVLCPQGAA